VGLEPVGWVEQQQAVLDEWGSGEEPTLQGQALPSLLPQHTGGEVDGEIGLIQVVVQVGEDLPVAGRDLRREGEKQQVEIIPVELERPAEEEELAARRVAVGGGSGDRIVEAICTDDVVDLAVGTEQRVHLIVGDYGAPELPLGSHRGAGALSAHCPQQQEVGTAEATCEVAENARGRHGYSLSREAPEREHPQNDFDGPRSISMYAPSNRAFMTRCARRRTIWS
jgi:hypothetical protein